MSWSEKFGRLTWKEPGLLATEGSIKGRLAAPRVPPAEPVKSPAEYALLFLQAAWRSGPTLLDMQLDSSRFFLEFDGTDLPLSGMPDLLTTGQQTPLLQALALATQAHLEARQDLRAVDLLGQEFGTPPYLALFSGGRYIHCCAKELLWGELDYPVPRSQILLRRRFTATEKLSARTIPELQLVEQRGQWGRVPVRLNRAPVHVRYPGMPWLTVTIQGPVGLPKHVRFPAGRRSKDARTELPFTAYAMLSGMGSKVVLIRENVAWPLPIRTQYPAHVVVYAEEEPTWDTWLAEIDTRLDPIIENYLPTLEADELGIENTSMYQSYEGNTLAKVYKARRSEK